MPVVWLPVATEELNDAVSRYNAVRPELGTRFKQAVDQTVEAIANGSLHFAVVSRER